MFNKNSFEEVVISLLQKYLNEISLSDRSERTKFNLMIGILIQINAEIREFDTLPTTLTIFDLCKFLDSSYTTLDLTHAVIEDLKCTYGGHFDEMFGHFDLCATNEQAKGGEAFIVISVETD